MTSSLVSASAFTAAGSLLLRLPVAGAAPPPVSGPVPPASPVSAVTTPPPSVPPLRLQLVLEVDLIASTTSATVTLAAGIPTAVEPAAAVSARPAVQCMTLQKPDLVHSPVSYCLQQASLKSVTGVSSA